MIAAVSTVLSLHGQPEPASTHLRRFAAELSTLSKIADDIAAATRRDRGEHRPVTAGDLTPARHLAVTAHAHARAALDAARSDTSTLARITDYILSGHAVDGDRAAT